MRSEPLVGQVHLKCITLMQSSTTSTDHHTAGQNRQLYQNDIEHDNINLRS